MPGTPHLTDWLNRSTQQANHHPDPQRRGAGVDVLLYLTVGWEKEEERRCGWGLTDEDHTAGKPRAPLTD